MNLGIVTKKLGELHFARGGVCVCVCVCVCKRVKPDTETGFRLERA